MEIVRNDQKETPRENLCYVIRGIVSKAEAKNGVNFNFLFTIDSG